MATIKGTDFMISFDLNGQKTVVCYATDCQINRTYDVKEISGQQGRSRDYLADYKGYTIEIPILIVYTQAFNYLNFANAAESGMKLSWSASAFINGGVVLSGTALITSINMSSQMRDVMKADVSLIGCGDLVTTISPIVKQVYLSDFDKIQLVGCPNPYPVSVFWYDLTLIGPASNADEVMSIFNEYSDAHGGYYHLISSVDGGCLFNMEIQFDAPDQPDVVYAQPGALFAISTDQSQDNVMSSDQDLNNVLTPIG